MPTAFPPRGPLARRLARAGLLLALVLATATCATPTDSVLPPGEDPPTPFKGSLQLTGPGSLLINQSELFTVTARDEQGQAVEPWPVGFRSSDQSIAIVSANGVVTARGRGTAIISATRDSASTSVTVEVDAQLELNPSSASEWATVVTPTVGDSIQLEAQLVDVNGERIGVLAATGWVSSDPAIASVSQEGLVITHQSYQDVTITASTPEGPVSFTFYAEQVQPPTVVRLAHGAQGVGPITFKIHRHPDVILNFGESADAALTSSGIYAKVEGIPAADLERHTFASSYLLGGILSLYAVHGPLYGGLVAGWRDPGEIPPGTGMVRLVQGGSMPVMYLRDPGGSTAGTPSHCYFDPGMISNYFPRASGDFDLLSQTKVGFRPDPNQSFVRLPANLPDGAAITLVLSGATTSTTSYVAFVDQ